MTQRTCDCGWCDQEFTAIGAGTVPTWNHPDQGGKYFASEACRDKYLKTKTRPCQQHGCQTLVLMEHGLFCAVHQPQTDVAAVGHTANTAN